MGPWERWLRRAINPVSTGLTERWLASGYGACRSARMIIRPARHPRSQPVRASVCTARSRRRAIGKSHPERVQAGTGCRSLAPARGCARCLGGCASGIGRRFSIDAPTSGCGGTVGGACSRIAPMCRRPLQADRSASQSLGARAARHLRRSDRARASDRRRCAQRAVRARASLSR